MGEDPLFIPKSAKHVYYQAIRDCLQKGALNQFLEIDIDKDIRRQIHSLREDAQNCRDVGDLELLATYESDESREKRRSAFFKSAERLDKEADTLAEKYGVEAYPIIEMSALETSITQAFMNIYYILNQRAQQSQSDTSGRTSQFYDEMVDKAKNKEQLLFAVLDKEKRNTSAEMHPSFDRVKQAYRAAFIIATTPAFVSYEQAMQKAAEQLTTKDNPRQL